jgi:hypothetical protein
MDVRYAAGLFDGEGSVGVYSHRFQLTITNTHRGVLEGLRELFGVGSVLTQRSVPGRRVVYVWVVTNRAAVQKVLSLLRPFLIIKAEKADEVLAMAALPTKQDLNALGCVECGGPVVARRLCRSHYQRVSRRRLTAVCGCGASMDSRSTRCRRCFESAKNV